MQNKIQKYERRIQELENRLYSAKSAVEELKVLNEIAIAAGSAIDIDQTLNLVLNRTIKAVNAEHGAIFLVAENQKEVLKTFIKQDNTSKIKESYHIGDHITGWVLFNKMSLIIKDLGKDERFKTPEEEKENIKSLICSPIWFEGKIIGILQMINKKSAKGGKESFTDNDLTLLSIISVQTGQLIKNSELQQLNYEKKKETEHARLRAEKAELQAKEMEAEKEIEEQKIRTRIAADLHDEIATNLSSIAMFSKIVQEESGKNLPARQSPLDSERSLTTDRQGSGIASQFLERISAISQESVNSIRDIIWAIDSKPETIYDLMLRLKDTYVTIFLAKNITFNFDVPPKGNLPSTNLSPEQRKNIWLILKEALNNSVKHCFCKTVSLTLHLGGNSLNVIVMDNGKGFDISLNHIGKGMGTMRKRAESINADLTITSNKDEGTILSLNLKI